MKKSFKSHCYKKEVFTTMFAKDICIKSFYLKNLLLRLLFLITIKLIIYKHQLILQTISQKLSAVKVYHLLFFKET